MAGAVEHELAGVWKAFRSTAAPRLGIRSEVSALAVLELLD
jgi:hypothetical protein